MKKNGVFSLLLASVLAAAIVCGAIAAELTKEFLTGQSFKYGTVISSGELKFAGGGAYSFTYESEGINWYDTGTYSIQKEKVYLEPSFCSTHREGEGVECSETMGNAVCAVKEEPNDLLYFKYFVCTSKNNKDAVSGGNPSMAFPLESFRVKAGTSKIWRGVPVITMGPARGKTTTSVKIREKPSVNAKALDYIEELYAPDRTFQSVPADTEVTVIARTRDKDKVQSWNNYWYLVNAGVMSNVWMYGEFVKVK
jgi:hypothetical protein